MSGRLTAAAEKTFVRLGLLGRFFAIFFALFLFEATLATLVYVVDVRNRVSGVTRVQIVCDVR